MKYGDLSRLLCLTTALLCSCCLVFTARAEITGTPLLPGWADATTATGTHCACDAYSIRANDSSVIVTSFIRSIRCQTYTTNISRIDIDTGYTCRCFDMEVSCGYLANSVVYQTTDPDDAYCRDNGVTASTSFASTAPGCIDAFNKSCGVTAGVRTDTKLEFANTTGAGIYCRKDIVRIDCTTGICATNPDACLLNETYSEWSQCAAIRGECKKTRVRGIAREAINGAPPCPSLIERTQFGDCTEEECANIQCKYDEQRVVGPCSKPCGPLGLRNVTWVNISLTQLDRCTEEFELIIEQEEEACPGNPPCTEEDLGEEDEGTAVVPECMTQGNAGHRGAHPAHIRIAFDIPISAPTGASLEMVSAFTVLHAQTGRRMPMSLSEIEIGDTYIILPFEVSEYDDEGSTGDKYYVHFRGVPDLDFSITGNDDVDIPPFTCLTTDESPPALLYATRREGSDTLLLTFSEPVIGDGVSYINLAGFTMEDITVEEGTASPLYDSVEDDIGVPHMYMAVTSLGSTPRLKPAGDDVFYDAAGNGNYVPSLWIFLGISQQVIWTPTGRGGKLYSSNNTAGIIDRALVVSLYPIARTYLLKNSALFRVRPVDYSIYLDPLFVTGISFASEHEFEYVDRFTLSFTAHRTSSPYFTSDPLSSLNNLYTAGIDAYDLLLDPDNVKLPVDWDQSPTPNTGATVYLANPVSIFAARVTVGESNLTVEMSLADDDANSTFVAQDFVYKGTNSIISLVSIGDDLRTLTFNMTLNFTSDMLLTDYIYYNGSGTSALAAAYGRSIWRGVNITTFNGTRPAVKTAAVLTQNNGSSISVVSFTFDAPVDSTSVDTTLLSLTSSNPLITSVSVTDAIVSDDNLTVSFNISTDCTGEGCYDTSGTFASMSLSGIKDVYGNKMLSYSTSSAFDLAAPTIASVIALGKRTLVFKWTEPVSFANMSNISPKPVACYGGGSSAVSCRYAKPLDAGTRIYIKSPVGAKIFDLQGNTMLEGQEHGVDLQSVDKETKCSNPFTDVSGWQAGLVLGTAGVGLVISVYFIVKWVRACRVSNSVAKSVVYTRVVSEY